MVFHPAALSATIVS